MSALTPTGIKGRLGLFFNNDLLLNDILRPLYIYEIVVIFSKGCSLAGRLIVGSEIILLSLIDGSGRGRLLDLSEIIEVVVGGGQEQQEHE